MKFLVLALSLFTSMSVIACEEHIPQSQIHEAKSFISKVASYGSDQGFKCEALRTMDGEGAVEIAFLRDDGSRTQGTVVRNFTAHLLCTWTASGDRFYHSLDGKVSMEYSKFPETNDSCSGMVHRHVLRVRF